MDSFPGTDAEVFLKLARSWAATVTVVTVLRTTGLPPGALPIRDGFTATAFLTISLKPPLILISASNDSSAAEMLKSSDHFAVNLLAAEQSKLAASFAIPHLERREDLWSEVRWQPDDAGVPVLTESLGAFSAQRSQVLAAGDHTLVLGSVTQVHRGVEAQALIYANRTYGRLEPL